MHILITFLEGVLGILRLQIPLNIVEFIEKNLGRNILIHCRAGISKSQAVCRFILETYPDMYIKDESHNIEKANIDVLAKLKRVIWEREHPQSFFEKLFNKKKTN